MPTHISEKAAINALPMLLTVKSLNKRFKALCCATMLFCLAASPTIAYDRPLTYETSRSLGMGGTSVAIADDQQALFCNPAGLGMRTTSAYSVLSATGDRSEDYDNVSDHIDKLTDSDTSASRAANFNNLMNIMGKTGYQSWSAMAYYLGGTGFGMAGYYRETENFSVENPSSPLVKSRVDKDAVLTGSFARGYGESQILFKDRATGWWGGTLKIASRKTADHTFYARDFAALMPEALRDTERSGVAMDFDLGAIWQLNNPWQATLGLFAGNLLNSSFSEEAGNLKRQFAIGASLKPLTGPPERNEKLLLAADYWETGENTTGLAKLRLGMQLRLSRHLHLLAGLRGGYPTGGIAFAWHDLKVQAASYGEELGQRPGEREDRRTSVSANLEF
ncbi:MAG: conjugal transfer protein TraF [Candidatus Riflebacteria bacterium]|nr:conjugal transfer protein TraF [Candidatus Riflebacteria bacterium]